MIITNNYGVNKTQEDEEYLEDIIKNARIFEDKELNRLIIKSLIDTHVDYIKVIYYLYNKEFNCTKEHVWYHYNGNKWMKDGMYILKNKIINNYV